MENTAIAAGQTDIPAMPVDEQIAKLKAEVAALRSMIFTNGDRNQIGPVRAFQLRNS